MTLPTLAEVKKALYGAATVAIGAVISYNIPGWIEGSEPFNWRSVLAGVVGAMIGYAAVYFPRNQPPAA